MSHLLTADISVRVAHLDNKVKWRRKSNRMKYYVTEMHFGLAEGLTSRVLASGWSTAPIGRSVILAFDRQCKVFALYFDAGSRQ